VFSKSLSEQESFKSGFENRKSLIGTACGNELQSDGAETGKHAGIVCPGEWLDQQRDITVLKKNQSTTSKLVTREHGSHC